MEAAFGMRALKDMFGFPFRDEKKWAKFGIGSLVFISGFFVPVLPWIVLWGYAARITRNSIEGQEVHLPEWDDWGGLLLDGLRLFGVSLLLHLPSILLFVLGFGSYFTSMMGMAFTQETGGDQAVAPFIGLMMASMFFMFFAMIVGTLLSVAAWFLIPPAGAHVVASGRFGAIFEVRKWGQVLGANLGGFALVFFVMLGLYAVQYLLFYMLYMTMILCMVIPIAIAPITIYMLAISSLMAGQSYREGREKLEMPAVDNPSAGTTLAESPAV